MYKAKEIMTQSLATCSPDENAARVAEIMRDRDIGNVIVMENGRLRGIITDRDLAVGALTDDVEPQNQPIRKYMNPKVITGEPDWNLNKIARTMAKHQIRRLPIVENDQLIGIISLGDVARHMNRKGIVTDSLSAISKPDYSNGVGGKRNIGAILGLSLLALTSTGIALLTWTHSGREWRKQVSDTKLYHSAEQAMNMARDRVDDAASSKAARNLRQRVNRNIKDISMQLPRIEYKPPKRKSILFR
jgi:CBS domain-containing protein